MSEWNEIKRINRLLEGRRYVPYFDGGGVLTVGEGHTGDDIEDRRYSDAEINEFTRKDLEWAARGVRERIDAPLTPGQTIALVLFTNNVGVHAFSESTMARFVQDGDHERAVLEFPRWKFDNGKIIPGLRVRRALEAACYLGFSELVTPTYQQIVTRTIN